MWLNTLKIQNEKMLRVLHVLHYTCCYSLVAYVNFRDFALRNFSSTFYCP